MVYFNGTFVNNAFTSKDNIWYPLGTLTDLIFSIKSFALFTVYSDALNSDKSLARCFANQ